MTTKRVRRSRDHSDMSDVLQRWEDGKRPPACEPSESEREEAIACVYGLHPTHRVRSGHDHPCASEWLAWITPR